MDDGVIHTKRIPHETEEEHKKRHRKIVHDIFDILEQHDLYLKPEKCLFERREIDFLGVIIGNGTIRMDPLKITALCDRSSTMANPTHSHRSSSLLGLHWILSILHLELFFDRTTSPRPDKEEYPVALQDPKPGLGPAKAATRARPGSGFF